MNLLLVFIYYINKFLVYNVNMWKKSVLKGGKHQQSIHSFDIFHLNVNVFIHEKLEKIPLK